MEHVNDNTGGGLAPPANDNTRYMDRCARKAKFLALKAYDTSDLRASVVDLLADILHLCDSEGFDFPSVFESAAYHFYAERIGGQHG